MRRATEARVLAERLCRPQRIGIFGHRGVGKTTLLAMLYREAVQGRLGELRLAAGDARTADYLSDKIQQLEAGRTLPATLAETELRFHLYYRQTRLELLIRDYQGEHVELGRSEPVQEFLRDCDTIWICLDAVNLDTPAERFRRQQEFGQLLEQQLAREPSASMERPCALVLTKSDLLVDINPDIGDIANTYFAMTCHALSLHCLQHNSFAVSSLGKLACLQPLNLAGPLAWLATSLREQDEARLERLWSLAGRDATLLERCLRSCAYRYPDAPFIAQYRERLRRVHSMRTKRRSLVAAMTAACLAIGLWCYDAAGHSQARNFEAEHLSDPAATLEQWRSYQNWHPTRHWMRPGSVHQEQEHLSELSRRARQSQRDQQLAQLRRRVTDPTDDPVATWRQFQELCASFPELNESKALEALRAKLKSRRNEQMERVSQRAFDQMTRAEQESVDLSILVAHADHFLREYSGSRHEAEVRSRRSAYLLRLEERDVEVARAYSGRQPLNFQTRREHYQRYLDRHPTGAFAKESIAALEAINSDWDKYDFRAVRDHFTARPGEITELVALCRTYLGAHPKGAFASSASDPLRWTERVTASGEYKVVLRSGQFESKIAHFFSRGPDLSVELEVAGVRYGPSNIVVNRYDPEWNYEFPRRIRWKLGDPVRISVTDHDYWDRVVLDIVADNSDPLAMKFLAGEVWLGKNRLTFESDFTMPQLPAIE